MNRLQIGSALIGCALFLAPAAAHAHAFAKQPPARNADEPNLRTRGGGKNGPCAGMPRTTKPPTAYAMGATVTVQIGESVDHVGCYQVWFSPANDQNFVKLGQLNDPQNNVPANGSVDFNMNVTLPAGVTCKDCTLQVLQLMKGSACDANENAANVSTYYSCADIRVGDFPDAGPTTPPMPVDPDASVIDPDGTSGGPSTTPTDGGGKTGESSSGNGASGNRRLSNSNSNDDGGCNTTPSSSTDGLSLATALGVVVGALAIVRRRKK